MLRRLGLGIGLGPLCRPANVAHSQCYFPSGVDKLQVLYSVSTLTLTLLTVTLTLTHVTKLWYDKLRQWTFTTPTVNGWSLNRWLSGQFSFLMHELRNAMQHSRDNDHPISRNNTNTKQSVNISGAFQPVLDLDKSPGAYHSDCCASCFSCRLWRHIGSLGRIMSRDCSHSKANYNLREQGSTSITTTMMKNPKAIFTRTT